MMMDRWQTENYIESIERKMKKQTTNHKATNADRIRNMSNKELAKWLNETIYNVGENLFTCEEPLSGKCKDCEDCYLVWLQEEAKE